MRRRLFLAAVSLPLLGVAFTSTQQRVAGDMVARVKTEGCSAPGHWCRIERSPMKSARG